MEKFEETPIIQNIKEEIVDVDENLTASEYKKSLNKKVSEFSEEEKHKYNVLTQKKKRKKDKIIEEEKSQTAVDTKNDLERKTLYNQLFVLKNKFPENTKEIFIDEDMNLNTLNEKKALMLQVITSKDAHRVVFQSLLLLCKTTERGLEYLDIDDLNGWNDEVASSEEDIVPILKELIDAGSIDVSFLTPELRLMIVMSGTAIRTLEKNRAKKKVVEEDVPSVTITENDGEVGSSGDIEK